MFAVIVMVAGVLMAAWIGFGRAAFGIGGEFVLVYTLLAGTVIAALNIAAGRYIAKTKRNGFSTQARTVVALIVAWFGAVMFGLTVADFKDGALHSVIGLLGDAGLLGISIGLSNLFGIMTLGGSIAAVVFSRLDSRGPKPEEVPDDVDFVQPLPPPMP